MNSYTKLVDRILFQLQAVFVLVCRLVVIAHLDELRSRERASLRRLDRRLTTQVALSRQTLLIRVLRFVVSIFSYRS